MSGKYTEWLTEEKLKLLQEWGKNGLTNSQIAKNMGVSERTLYGWLKRYKVLSDNLNNGKALADREIENSLYKRALGYEIQEEKITIEELNGVVKKKKQIIKKHVPGNVTAQIFWLKNRKSKEWRNNEESIE